MATIPNNSMTEAYMSNDPKYHNNKDAAYVLPNDHVEHNRLEAQAKHLQAIMNDEIIHSPVPRTITNANILDVGCGTGIVTDHLGARFPNANVYGLDISPVPISIRPAHPPNVQFLQGNIVSSTSPSEWLPQQQHSSPSSPSALSPSSQFDLIFSRLLVCGMTNWPAYISKCHSLLTPSGYLELHDMAFTIYHQAPSAPSAKPTEISRTWRWNQACKSAARNKGMDWDCSASIPAWLEAAGFKDVQVKTYKWPIGGMGHEDPVWRAWGDFVAEQIKGMAWHLIPKVLEGEAKEGEEGGYGEAEIEEFRREMLGNFEPEEGKFCEMSVFTARK